MTPEGIARTRGYTWMQTVSGTFGVLAYAIGAVFGNFMLIYVAAVLVVLFSVVPALLIEEPRVLPGTTTAEAAAGGKRGGDGFWDLMHLIRPLWAFLVYDVPASKLALVASTGVAALEPYPTSLHPKSFVAEVAANEQPTQITDARSTQLEVPSSLRESGIHSLLGLRLPPVDDLLGVMYVGIADTQLALAALMNFGVSEARFFLVRHAGKTVCSASRPPSLPSSGTVDDLFEEGQYLLRVHEPGYQEPEAIELELIWLDAMPREANLPVPEPIAALDGRYLLPIIAPGVPGTRNCSILRWTKGRSVKNRFRVHHLRAQGRLMARLHNFATQWQPPLGLCKRKFDWNGLFRNNVGSGMANAEAGRCSPHCIVKLFRLWRSGFGR